MFKLIFPLEEITKRFKLLGKLLLDKNFWLALCMLACFLFAALSFEPQLVIPLFVLSMILTSIIAYDFFISYLAYKINLFNVYSDIYDYTVGEVVSKFKSYLPSDLQNKWSDGSLATWLKKAINWLAATFIPAKTLRKYAKLPIFSWPWSIIKGAFTTSREIVVNSISSLIAKKSFTNFLFKYFYTLYLITIKLPFSILFGILKAFYFNVILKLHLIILKILLDIIFTLLGVFAVLLCIAMLPFIALYRTIMNFVGIVLFIISLPVLVFKFFISLFVGLYRIARFIYQASVWLAMAFYRVCQLMLNNLKVTFAASFVLLLLIAANLYIPNKTGDLETGNAYGWYSFTDSPSFLPSLLLIAVAFLLVRNYKYILENVSKGLIALLGFIFTIVSTVIIGPAAFFIFVYFFYLSLSSNPTSKVFSLVIIKLVAILFGETYQNLAELVMLTFLIATDFDNDTHFIDFLKPALQGDYQKVYGMCSTKQAQSEATAG